MNMNNVHVLCHLSFHDTELTQTRRPEAVANQDLKSSSDDLRMTEDRHHLAPFALWHQSDVRRWENPTSSIHLQE